MSDGPEISGLAIMLGGDQHGDQEGKHVRRSTIIGGVLACGLALAACSPGEEPSDQPPVAGTPPPTTTEIHPGQERPQGAAEEHTTTDREFAQGVLAHRQQTLQLATFAARNSTNAQIKALAARIEQAARPQVDQLNTWLSATAGQDSGSAPEDAADDSAAHTTALRSPEQLLQLADLRGNAFDRQWTDTLIALHGSTLNLARVELEEGQDKQMRALAESIVATQQDELDDLGQVQR